MTSASRTSARRMRNSLSRERIDLENNIHSPGLVHPRFYAHAPDLFHRLLRAPIARADEKYDVANKSEGVPQHQVLHLAVVNAAPICPRQKRESDFDFAPLLVVPEIARRADDAPVFFVDHDDRAA